MLTPRDLHHLSVIVGVVINDGMDLGPERSRDYMLSLIDKLVDLNAHGGAMAVDTVKGP